MSSPIRRIERVTKPSHPVEKGKRMVINPPRDNGYMGRGEKLGVHNPKAKDLLARQKREQARKSKEGN